MKKNSRKAVFLRNSVMYAVESMQSADTLQAEKLFTACLQRTKKRTKPFGRKKKKNRKVCSYKEDEKSLCSSSCSNRKR